MGRKREIKMENQVVTNNGQTETAATPGRRGRPKGSFSAKTVAAASARGLSPEQYVQALAAEKAATPKRPRGRPKKQAEPAQQ
jgi:hypothetical protein